MRLVRTRLSFNTTQSLQPQQFTINLARIQVFSNNQHIVTLDYSVEVISPALFDRQIVKIVKISSSVSFGCCCYFILSILLLLLLYCLFRVCVCVCAVAIQLCFFTFKFGKIQILFRLSSLACMVIT